MELNIQLYEGEDTMKTASRRESFLPPLWILSLISIALAVWALSALKEMVVLLVLSFSVAYVISPLLEWLEKKGVSRHLSVLLVGIAMLAVAVIACATTIPTLLREYRLLIDNFPSYMDSARERLAPVLTVVMPYLPQPWAEAIESGSFSSVLALNENIPKRIVETLWSTLLSGYNLTLSLVNAFIFPFVVYYIAIDYRRLYDGFLSWIPFLQRKKAATMLTEINEQVSAYVRGQLLVGFILFVLFSIGLGFLGVELWLLVAFISGFGNLVPYVGSIVGILLATVMALVTYGTFASVLSVWALYGIVQALEGTFITPRVIGETLGLSPLVIILALIAGGSLLGLLGIFLAVPFVAAMKVIIRHLHIWLMNKADI